MKTKRKSYLFGLLLFFLCVSVAQAYEIGRCKFKIPDGPMLRFAWLYYKDHSGERKLISTLPMQLFQQNAKINGVSRDITICGGNTSSCNLNSKPRIQNSDGTTTMGETNLVKMGNEADRVLFERKDNGNWKYTLMIRGANPSNDISQEGVIANLPDEPSQCSIMPFPNNHVSLKVAIKYINNSAQDLVNYKHGDCDNGRSCTLPPEVIKFSTSH